MVLLLDRPLDNLRTRRAPDADKSAALAQAHTLLRNELSDALLNEPQRQVWVPGFTKNKAATMPAAAVVDDMLAGADGDARWHDILMVLGAAARGEDVELRAQLVISLLAGQHAAFHCDDAVDA